MDSAYIIRLKVTFSLKIMQVSAMALSITIKHWPLAFGVFCIILSFCEFGKTEGTPPEIAAAGVLANEYFAGQEGINQDYPETGTGQGGINQDYPETGTVDNKPDHIFEEALHCFNEKKIYSSCNEAYRLSQSGELHVPPEDTDEYCNGPCLSETHLVLNCIEGLVSHFKFYNRATIKDVRKTIKSGCSYGPKRGDFNVAEHVQEEYSNAPKTSSSFFLSGLVAMIMACRVML